jgi:hypothetical protein
VAGFVGLAISLLRAFQVALARERVPALERRLTVAGYELLLLRGIY